MSHNKLFQFSLPVTGEKVEVIACTEFSARQKLTSPQDGAAFDGDDYHLESVRTLFVEDEQF